MLSSDSDVNVPVSAVKIKVTSLINPYMIRVLNTKEYNEKEAVLSRKLHHKFLIKKPSKQRRVHLGMMVLTNHNICEHGIELPSWTCRGILGNQDPNTLKYNVFLMDYGISIELHWNEFVSIAKKMLPEDPLTFSIGLYNIMPIQATLKQPKNRIIKEEDQIIITAMPEWTEKAIEFTKKSISVAKTIMFEPMFSDENGKLYGELYLFIEDSIFKLRDMLVEQLHAVYITDEMTQLLNSNDNQQSGEIDHFLLPYCYGPENTNLKEKQNAKTNNGEKSEFENEMHSISMSINKVLKLSTYKENGQTMLVHSNIKVKKLNALENAPFPRPVHKFLRNNNITGVRRIQSYMWPAIIKGTKVVAISSSGTGKTYGHAIAVSSSLIESDSVPTGNVPSVLVLCSSTKEVFEVTALYEHILSDLRHLHVISAFNGKNDRSLTSEIYSGCQVLVSTPPFLCRFLQKYKDTINLKSVRYLVFDKADLIFDKYFDSVLKLLVKHEVIENKSRIVNSISLQMIAVAQKWSVSLKKFTQTYMSDPYICIDSCMEAAIYTGIKTRAVMIASDKKLEGVLSLLQTTNMLRTMIVCAFDEEVEMLDTCLKSHSKSTIAIDGKTDCLVIADERKSWYECISGMYPIIICTDEVLSDLSVNNVDHLIHFSFPPISKRQFHYRFSTLMDNLMMGNKETKITMIIDENNELQLKSLIDPMKRLGIKVPDVWEKTIENFVATEDKKKEHYDICNYVKALGFCPNNNFCKYRHCILKDVDQPVTPVEIGDEITCVVNYIHDASHFSIRIVDYTHTNDNGEKETIKMSGTSSLVLTEQMQRYYSDVKHRRHSKNIAVGKLYAYESTIDQFQRVQVLHIELKDSNGHAMSVTIRCIDSGIVINNISVYRLYEITSDFIKTPSHIIEAFLTGIAPFDDEYDWNDCTNSMVSQWFEEYNKPGATYIYAKVNLHVGNTIWINSLETRTKIIGHKDLTTSSLKSYLIQKNHAIENKDHLEKLIKLCKLGEFNKVKAKEYENLDD